MREELAAYYAEHVVAAFIECRDAVRNGMAGKSRDVRSALAAASALFHFREHLEGSASLSRAEAESKCADYAIVGDVTNASKHREIARKTPHGPPLVRAATDISEEIVITMYLDELGEYRGTVKAVAVTLSDGTRRDLVELLANVLNFWERHLVEHGLLSTVREFRPPANVEPRSRAECASDKITMVIVAGLRWRQVYRLMKYNYALGKVEMMDLTGMSAKGRIHQGNRDVGVSFTHQPTGKKFACHFELTDEEFRLLNTFGTEQERQSYVESLPVAQDALAELREEMQEFVRTLAPGGESLPDS